MNSMTKIALVGASVLSFGALTACQSTNTVKDKEGDHARMMHSHHQKHERKMTPEQREQFQQARAERKQMIEHIKQACDGKAVGSAVQIKAGDKTIAGTCVMTFKADHQAMKKMRAEHHQMKGEHRPMRGEMKGMRMQQGGPLTDAKRAELTRQFDQRLAEHQAKQQAMLKACQGQPNGKAVQVKVGAQSIEGKCKVRFLPQAPVTVTPSPVKSAA
ncbi:hypothetical protein [Acinetobacter sp. TSRC1-2]|uniref:hypothetical protein n=1 Tax=unclassified Acinetobacter TaxID=196816 RepID=UPI003CF1F18D